MRNARESLASRVRLRDMRADSVVDASECLIASLGDTCRTAEEGAAALAIALAHVCSSGVSVERMIAIVRKLSVTSERSEKLH